MPVELTRRNFRQYDKDQAHAGMYAPAVPTFSNFTLSANRGYLQRVVPSRSMTITVIGFAVFTAAGADDACDVGIYSSGMSRLVSSGATTGKLNSLGAKTISVTATTLQAGVVYYAGFSCGAIGGTAGVLVGHTFQTGPTSQLFGTTAGLFDQEFANTHHPLPSTFTPSGSGVAIAPILALRES